VCDLVYVVDPARCGPAGAASMAFATSKKKKSLEEKQAPRPRTPRVLLGTLPIQIVRARAPNRQEKRSSGRRRMVPFREPRVTSRGRARLSAFRKRAERPPRHAPGEISNHVEAAERG